MGKYRLKEAEEPNYDLNHKLTSVKRKGDYRYTTDQILHIKRTYNQKIFNMKKRKLEILNIISNTKKKVHELNIQLKVDDDEDAIFS